MSLRPSGAALAAALLFACGNPATRGGTPASPGAPASDPSPARPPPPRLSITFTGQGAGTVRVYDAQSFVAECAVDCVVPLSAGKHDVLALPAPGAKFIAWGGPCVGPGRCTIDVEGEVALSARFDAVPPLPWRYDSADVTTLDGVRVMPATLDDEGRIAGTYEDGGERGVFLWGGQLVRIPLPPGRTASVAATRGGWVAGTLSDANAATGATAPGYRAFVANADGLRELDDGDRATFAVAVDADGVVAGSVDHGSGISAATRWKDGVAADLGRPSEAYFMNLALAIDDSGTVLGASCSPDPAGGRNCVGVRFDAAGPVLLGPMPTAAAPVSMSPGGAAVLYQSPSQTFLWDGGVIADIAAEAARYSWPVMGIGAGGRLSSETHLATAGGDAAVALWVPISEGADGTLALRHEGELYDLNDAADLGAVLTPPRRLDGARAINARGQILAYASRAGGTYLLLTPRK